MLRRACATALLVGCLRDTGQVTIRVELPHSLGREQAQLVLTRFDVAGITDSIARAADDPEPDFTDIEQEFTDFEPSGSDMLDSLRGQWLSSRREIVRLADSLSRIGRDAPGYGAAYDRLRALHQQLTAGERLLEQRMTDLVPAASLRLARAATSAADSLRAWEARALASLPAVLDSLAAELGPPLIIGLPPDGRLERRLPTGRWWAGMRLPHPENPFLEYYWETSFTVNGMIPLVVPLGERQMQVRWRH